MTFTRSANGIGNRNLFTNTIFTVYLETAPDKDIAKGIDQGFWREFFGNFFKDISIKFVPLGGKPHVEKMAKKIIDNSIPNTLCALDSDYDDLVSRKINDERVFYTYGYGVENDVFAPCNFESILRALVPGAENHLGRVYKLDSQKLTNMIQDNFCGDYFGSLVNGRYRMGFL